ncbi:MAG: dTDP-4-dehydrorhamnose 3,5-epimerase [Bacteroidota bacterium]
MPFMETPIAGLIVFEPKVWKDDRGYFYESYNTQTFAAAGIDAVFVQDNQSLSTKGVLRGLHYQVAPFAQAKLVRVLEGEVLDVAVDIREESPTYGQHYSIRLSAENKKQLFIPRGFAHGFVVLSETAVFSYKCDNFYAKEQEGGIRYNDPQLNIDWLLPADQLILSPKDEQHPLLGAHRPVEIPIS